MPKNQERGVVHFLANSAGKKLSLFLEPVEEGSRGGPDHLPHSSKLKGFPIPTPLFLEALIQNLLPRLSPSLPLSPLTVMHTLWVKGGPYAR